MRSIAHAGLVAALLASLLSSVASCGSGHDKAATAAEEKVLHVYNWNDYIAPTTIADFETRTGIKVVYDVYDSFEVLETKLLTGHSGYDVVVTSGGPTRKLIDAGAIKTLDRSKLRNLANLDPRIVQLQTYYDPGNAHTVPYLLGTTGIGYNPDQVEKALGTRTIDSFAAVFDPAIASKLAKCGITWLDSPADLFQVAFIYLGLDANSERPQDRAAAEALLTRVRPYVRYFSSSQYLNDLASGDVCVSIGWSGAIQQARARGAEAAQPVQVVYVIPKEGAPLWSDLVQIPVDAPHPELAHVFIDYLMEPKVMAAITNTVGEANGNTASTPYVDEAIRNNPAIYPTDETYQRLTVDRSWSPAQMREVDRAWTRIQTAK
ncbi:MAG TPA: polyamine ABC transporter substrate-binding protein [Steroidobacteraceae bacterium]|nr:polyamine ABC transporter substrate-binding protein [Steroidobacteraceae bacterium]HQR49701.1 polyamine ABC transporter substrate-binding protein [Steroidobacteraceae bacterium]